MALVAECSINELLPKQFAKLLRIFDENIGKILDQQQSFTLIGKHWRVPGRAIKKIGKFVKLIFGVGVLLLVLLLVVSIQINVERYNPFTDIEIQFLGNQT